MIAVGYIQTDGTKTKFQYADAGESAEYKKVKDKLATLKVGMEISQSQSDMPYILAKNPKVPDLDYAKALTANYWKYLLAITKSANSLQTAPYGAYIGGMSTVSKLFIVGPSALDQYPPAFRSPADAAIKKSYDAAVTATNQSLGCIKKDKPTATPVGMGLDFADLNAPIVAPFQNGSLFKSYHGMIQAIVKYQTSIDSNSFFFEIALGNNTSKVSSCFPCCTFMTANGTPPTSTHLGRGDNWNIPPGCNDALRRAWEGNITAYYTKGKELLSGQPKIGDAVSALNANSATDKIPAVFLEALTFESKFTDKIKSALSIA